MAYETVTEVAYGDETFSVSGEIFTDIEDKHEAIDKLVGMSEGDKDIAKEWVTYNALIGDGRFISKPSEPEPSIAESLSKPDDGFTNNIPMYRPYEAPWTQEKILAEKEKLLKKEEALLRKHQQELSRQVFQLQQQKNKGQWVHDDGTPYKKTEYGSIILALLAIMFVMVICRGC